MHYISAKLFSNTISHRATACCTVQNSLVIYESLIFQHFPCCKYYSLHCVQKRPTFSLRNIDILKPLLIILLLDKKNITEDISSQNTHLTNVSALPGKTQEHIFHLNVVKIKVKKHIAVSDTSTAPLWELMWHMGSHSVTCHPAEVTFPPLPQPIKAGTRFSNPRGMQG